MSKIKLSISIRKAENIKPACEPYPEQEPLDPSKRGYPSKKDAEPFNDDDQKKGDDLGRDDRNTEHFK